MIDITEAMALEMRRTRTIRPIGSIMEHNISWRHITQGVFFSIRVDSYSKDINGKYRAFLTEKEAHAFRVLAGW